MWTLSLSEFFCKSFQTYKPISGSYLATFSSCPKRVDHPLFVASHMKIYLAQVSCASRQAKGHQRYRRTSEGEHVFFFGSSHRVLPWDCNLLLPYAASYASNTAELNRALLKKSLRVSQTVICRYAMQKTAPPLKNTDTTVAF